MNAIGGKFAPKAEWVLDVGLDSSVRVGGVVVQGRAPLNVASGQESTLGFTFD